MKRTVHALTIKECKITVLTPCLVVGAAMTSAAAAAVEAELSTLWGSGQEWILIFDKLLKHPNGKPKRGCRCDLCEADKPPPSPYSPQQVFKRRRQTVQASPSEVASAVLKPKKLSEPFGFAPNSMSGTMPDDFCECCSGKYSGISPRKNLGIMQVQPPIFNIFNNSISII